VGLDRDERPIDALASNMGHCLWSGIVDDDKAHVAVERLMSAEMFTGWGVRTLAASMGAYNPMSYHNGSVWPHDSALVATGLMRYGFVEPAQRIATGLLEAWPREYAPITIRQLSLAGVDATLHADADEIELTGLPDDIDIRLD